MHDAQASVGEDLSVMLEKPALRLAQYPDLLKELIISLPPAHAAHPDLAAAVGAMEEVVQNVHSWHGEVQWMSGMRQLASTLAMGDTRHGPTLACASCIAASRAESQPWRSRNLASFASDSFE